MGCIGQDASGRILEQQMENYLYQKNSNSTTATCLILTTDQARYMILIYFDQKKKSFSSSRSMITNLGAANEFTIDYLNNSENWLYVERAQIFYVAVRFI